VPGLLEHADDALADERLVLTDDDPDADRGSFPQRPAARKRGNPTSPSCALPLDLRAATREDRRMPFPAPEQYREMLDAAGAGGFALPAVNVTSTQTLNAAIEGLADAGADGILQVTSGGAAYFAGAPADPVLGARAFAAAARELAAAAPVHVAIHTDHVPAGRADGFLGPLLAASAERVRAGGGPLFHSHMFDGSALALEDNLRDAARWLEAARAVGSVLEVEVGVVGGAEDDVDAEGVDPERLYTTPADLLRTAAVLGTGERGRYLLAATFGNVHGAAPPGRVHLRPEILGEGQAALAREHPGARFDYVFHGSSGSTPAELQAAIRHGVVKVNLDTDAQYAFTRAVAGHVLDHREGILRVDGGPGDKRAFDPRAWGRKAEAAMAGRVAAAAEELGAAGRSLAR
jgi:fructose-bisphosphate aldolase class II